MNFGCRVGTLTPNSVRVDKIHRGGDEMKIKYEKKHVFNTFRVQLDDELYAYQWAHNMLCIEHDGGRTASSYIPHVYINVDDAVGREIVFVVTEDDDIAFERVVCALDAIRVLLVELGVSVPTRQELETYVREVWS